jgi:uncharacterized membrane protein
MDSVLFHPKLVHLPIALAILMPWMAGGLLLAWWRQWLPARAWVIAVALQALLVGAGLLALQSGEAEEERVEPFVAEPFLEAHEEAAGAFVWASGGVLGVMLLGLGLASRRPAGLAAATAATLGTLVVLGLGYRTGQAGGDLVYRHGAAQAYPASAATPPAPAGAPAQRPAGDDDD